MPFVKRQRTYYKDGVEVPSNTITDFGRTAYYKNIVTTKYWKEVTTGSKELEYACYGLSGTTTYAVLYAKAPIGSDLNTYATSGMGLATNSTQLTKLATWTNLSEEKGNNGNYIRLYEHDLYIDTTKTEIVEGTPEDYTYTTEETVTVEVTANDDYDYSEFIPSTQFDNYVDNNKLYQLAAVKRSYWKYVWEDYSLPKMTSNTTPEGKLTYDIGIGGPYTTNIYPIFFGGNSININGLYNQATRYLRYAFAKILKAGKYTFTYEASRQNNVTNNLNKWEAILEDDSRVEIMNPNITTSRQTFTVEFEVDKPIKAINLTLYASAPSEASCYYSINKIALTGEGLAENTVKASEYNVLAKPTDYDYYTDRLLSYAPIVRGKRSYFKQADKQRDTGTYTFTLNKDYTAKLLFVGNGGGGCSSQKDSRWHVSSGGSGACFEGTVRLPADTYTLTIGSLGYGNNANNTHYHSSSVVSTDSFLTNSAGQELIRVGAGGNGYTSVGGVGGAAGVLTLGTLDILETKKATDGVYTAGNVSTGSLSAYDNTYTGYGAGTSGTHGQGNVYGIAGIFDLVLETDINDYTYYEDVGTKIY